MTYYRVTSATWQLVALVQVVVLLSLWTIFITVTVGWVVING